MSLWLHTREKTVGMFNWRNNILGKISLLHYIILHIVIWYISNNFTQSLLMSFDTPNKLDLLVYVANKAYCNSNIFGTFWKVSFLSKLDSTFYWLRYWLLYFGTLCFSFVSVISISVLIDMWFINHEVDSTFYKLRYWFCILVRCVLVLSVWFLFQCIILMGKRELVACLICLPGVSWLLSGSSSRCHGVVCGLWLTYFLIILTIFNIGEARAKWYMGQNDAVQFFKRWCDIWRFLLQQNARFEIRHCKKGQAKTEQS